MQHGDVIVTNCTGIPLCVHTAIVLEEEGEFWIYNNTPAAKNSFGGNVVRQRPEEFFKGRKLLKVKPLGLCGEHVREVAWSLRFEKFDILRFNCEDFVNEVVNCQRISESRQKWALAGMALLVFLV